MLQKYIASFYSDLTFLQGKQKRRPKRTGVTLFVLRKVIEEYDQASMITSSGSFTL